MANATKQAQSESITTETNSQDEALRMLGISKNTAASIDNGCKALIGTMGEEAFVEVMTLPARQQTAVAGPMVHAVKHMNAGGTVAIASEKRRKLHARLVEKSIAANVEPPAVDATYGELLTVEANLRRLNGAGSASDLFRSLTKPKDAETK